MYYRSSYFFTVLPLICVLTWAATMEIHINFDTECVEKINATCNENNTCWDGYNELSPAYILFIPMIIALAVSVFTIIDILFRNFFTFFREIGYSTMMLCICKL